MCFYVYGTVKPGLLEPAFRELDHALAAKLGIPLFTRHADATYEIASILSHQWWDDSAWSEVVAR